MEDLSDLKEFVTENEIIKNCDWEFFKPDSLKVAGGEIIDGAYRGNKEIVKVRDGGNVKRIGASAFEGCSSLKEIVIEEGVEYVGEYAFKDCDALEVLYIPKSLKKIEDNAFGVTFVPDGPCDMREIGGDLAIKNIYYAGNRKEYYDDCCIEGIINVFEISHYHRITIYFSDGDYMYWPGPNEPKTESPDGLPF